MVSLHEALARRNVLAGEADHRVKNALQAVASYLRLHHAKTGDVAARDTLAAAGRQVHAVALLHDAIARNGSSPTVRIDDYTQQMAQLLTALMPDSVSLSVAFPPVAVPGDVAANVAMIMNEFVANSAKHAFPAGASGRVVINGEAEGARLIRITLADDGVGTDHATNAHGLGSRIIAAAARKLGCHLDRAAAANGGCQIVLSFTEPIGDGRRSDRCQSCAIEPRCALP